MANNNELELRVLIDDALRKLDQLERRFESTTREMDDAAEKVDFDDLRKDVRGLEGELDKTKTSAVSFGKVMAGLGAIVSIQALSRGFQALFGQLREGVKDAQLQAEAMAQVRQGIETTGGAAGRTAEQLLAMAEELEGIIDIDDDQILKEATANLLTFTNIADERFDRTLQLAADLAVRIGRDLTSSTIQLGKALNDPIANLSALGESGIQFSTAQKEVIKELASTNRLAEAQTIILDELEKQYGGSAKAAAEAGAQWGKLVTTLENFRENVSEGLVPVLADLSRQIVTNKGEIEALGTVIGDHLPKAIFRTVAAFQAVLAASLTANKVIIEGWQKLTGAISSIVDGIEKALDRIPAAVSKWVPGLDETRKQLGSMGDAAEEASKKAGELAGSFEELRDETVTKALENWAKAGRDWRDAAGEAAAATQEAKEETEELVPALEEAEEATKKKAKTDKASVKDALELSKAYREEADALLELSQAQLELSRVQGDVSRQRSEVQGLEDEVEQLREKQELQSLSVEDSERLFQAENELRKEKEKLVEVEKDETEALGDLREERQRLIDQAKEDKGGVEEQIEFFRELSKAIRESKEEVNALNEALTFLGTEGVAAIDSLNASLAQALETCKALKECLES